MHMKNHLTNPVNIYHNAEWDAAKPRWIPVLKGAHNRESLIYFRKGQLLKEHKASSPIMLHLLEGKIDFRFTGGNLLLQRGDLFSLEADVNHSLLAVEDSIVRLSIHGENRNNTVSS